jgi:GTP-binding protein Era
MFLDTPGIHQPQHKLGEYMMRVAQETIADADVILWLVDVNTPPKAEERQIAELLRKQHRKQPLPPLILGLNKVDQRPSTDGEPNERAQEYLALLDWLGAPDTNPLIVTWCILSGQTGQGIDQLMALLRGRLPFGPRYYPEDQVTDLQMRYLAAELIREQALRLLEQEVPHSIAVEVDEFTERSEELTYISATIYVERDSQKPIVLGQKGSMIKKIGQTARPEIEAMVGTKVYLELWVKVWERWRAREGMLRRLGYVVK